MKRYLCIAFIVASVLVVKSDEPNVFVAFTIVDRWQCPGVYVVGQALQRCLQHPRHNQRVCDHWQVMAMLLDCADGQNDNSVALIERFDFFPGVVCEVTVHRVKGWQSGKVMG